MRLFGVSARQVSILALLASLFGLAVAFAAPKVEGRIRQPLANAAVSTRITVSGTVHHLPSTAHLWLAVRKGRLMWPKAPEAKVDGENWTVAISEGGTPSGGTFELVLLAADKRGHEQIVEYHHNGDSTGDFPGLANITGASELNAVSVKMR
jgi:hypothetical protein